MYVKIPSRLALVSVAPSANPVLFVGSENLTVIVSPFENIESESSGSSATRDCIAGPTLFPKLPVKVGDVPVNANEVSSALSNLVGLSFTTNLKSPIAGAAAPGSIIVMFRDNGVIQEPA